MVRPTIKVMDIEHLKQVAPHYVAMIALVYLTLSIVRATIGDLGFWPELVIIAAVVLIYRPLVRLLGVSPSVWA